MPRHLGLTSSLLFVLAFEAIGCLPDRGTTPARTWRAEEPQATCDPLELEDPSGSGWSHDGAATLAEKADKREAVIVSALGCHVEVLPRCRSAARYEHTKDGWSLAAATVSAKALEGDCTGATHVVRAALAKKDGERTVPGRVELAPLSLDDFRLTGVWRGVMRQPYGPYEEYDVTMELAQDGNRVRGMTHLRTIDGAYWGELRFEGRLDGTTLFFHDAEIVDDNTGLFLGWCAKGGYLLVDPRAERARGPWRASLCMPGTMDVQFLGERHPLPPGTPVSRLDSRGHDHDG